MEAVSVSPGVTVGLSVAAAACEAIATVFAVPTVKRRTPPSSATHSPTKLAELTASTQPPSVEVKVALSPVSRFAATAVVAETDPDQSEVFQLFSQKATTGADMGLPHGLVNSSHTTLMAKNRPAMLSAAAAATTCNRRNSPAASSTGAPAVPIRVMAGPKSVPARV